jgi:putative nucleotidyltransferase with HDIG domain
MPQELSCKQIQKVLQGIGVPPQPQIMVDLQMEQYTGDPDLKTIARLIAQDPGLAGALLKIVNSGCYGLDHKVASIQRAVNLLGGRSVINLINAQSIKSEMSDETIVTLSRFWDTAQDVAMTSLTLAKRMGSQAVDEAYAVGLFHDCGIALMLKRFPDYMTVLERAYAQASPACRVVDAENQAFNTNHAVVGHYIAKSWRLPEPVIQAIGNHHNALAIFSEEPQGNSQMKNLLAILKMAEHICATHRVLGNQREDHEWNCIAPLVLDYVGLSDYDFENLKESLGELSAHSLASLTD